MNKGSKRGRPRSSPRLSSRQRPPTTPAASDASSTASPKPSTPSSANSDGKSTPKAQRELRKLEDYWTKNNGVSDHSPRLRKATFDLQAALGKKRKQEKKILQDEEKEDSEASNIASLPESPIPTSINTEKQNTCNTKDNVVKELSVIRENVKREDATENIQKSIESTSIEEKGTKKKQAMSSVRTIQEVASIRRSLRNSPYLPSPLKSSVLQETVDRSSEITKENPNETSENEVKGYDKAQEIINSEDAQSVISELSQGLDNPSDSEDDFIPPRKKLRSEVSEDELWEGIPLTVTFKRLAPIGRARSLGTPDCESFPSSQDSVLSEVCRSYDGKNTLITNNISTAKYNHDSFDTKSTKYFPDKEVIGHIGTGCKNKTRQGSVRKCSLKGSLRKNSTGNYKGDRKETEDVVAVKENVHKKHSTDDLTDNSQITIESIGHEICGSDTTAIDSVVPISEHLKTDKFTYESTGIENNTNPMFAIVNEINKNKINVVEDSKITVEANTQGSQKTLNQILGDAYVPNDEEKVCELSISQILDCDTDSTSQSLETENLTTSEEFYEDSQQRSVARDYNTVSQNKETTFPLLNSMWDKDVDLSLKCNPSSEDSIKPDIPHATSPPSETTTQEITDEGINNETTVKRVLFNGPQQLYNTNSSFKQEPSLIITPNQSGKNSASSSISKSGRKRMRKSSNDDPVRPTRRSLRLTEIDQIPNKPTGELENNILDETKDNCDSGDLCKSNDVKESQNSTEQVKAAANTLFGSIKSRNKAKFIPPLRIKLKKVKMSFKNRNRKIDPSYEAEVSSGNLSDEIGEDVDNISLAATGPKTKTSENGCSGKKKPATPKEASDSKTTNKQETVKKKNSTKGKAKKKTRRWSSPPNVSLRLNNERRQSAVNELKSNPMLDKHACLIWSSENRRQESFAHPDLSPTQLDDLLRDKWTSLTDREKLRYFQRAHDAVTDENRHSRKRHGGQAKDRAPSRTADSPDQSSMVRFLAMDSRAQISELKTWLHFYHEVSPEQYANVMSDFKASLSGQKELEKKVQEKEKQKQKLKKYKRKLKDFEVKPDSHAKYRRLLFEKLYEYREKVIGIWSEKKDMQNQIFLETFNSTVRRLVAGETIPLSGDVKSERLTEVLTDIRALEREKRVTVTGVLPDTLACRDVVKRLSSQRSPQDSMLMLKPATATSRDTELTNQELLTVLDTSHDENQLENHLQQIPGNEELPPLNPDCLADFFAEYSYQSISPSSSQHIRPRALYELQRPDSPGTILTEWVAEDILNSQPTTCSHFESRGGQNLNLNHHQYFQHLPQLHPHHAKHSSAFVVPRPTNGTESSKILHQRKMMSLLDKNSNSAISTDTVSGPYRAVKSAYTHSRFRSRHQPGMHMYGKVTNPLKTVQVPQFVDAPSPGVLLPQSFIPLPDGYNIRQAFPRAHFVPRSAINGSLDSNRGGRDDRPRVYRVCEADYHANMTSQKPTAEKTMTETSDLT